MADTTPHASSRPLRPPPLNLDYRNDPDAGSAYRHSPELTIRWARPDDAPKLDILAELEAARVPPPPLLLGFVGEELWVAASLSSGSVISHPLRRSGEVARLVLERGCQLTLPQPRHLRLGLLLRRPLRIRVGERTSETCPGSGLTFGGP